MEKVVARFANGRVVKGLSGDFAPGRATFHVSVAAAPAGTTPLEVRTKELKALFFVKDLDGDPSYQERKEFDAPPPAMGRRIVVEFHDGEVLVGTTPGYDPERPGFFLDPADGASNNDMCYILAASTVEIRLL